MIEKINTKFTVYDSEELSALELIEELGNLNNEMIDEINKKTDVLGDHKGSWQGLDKPTLSDEGMRATVEKHIKDISNINNDIATIKKAYPLLTIENEVDVIDYTKPYFHVERYGAKGDFSPKDRTGTDDTLAIQKAIDYCIKNLGGTVLFDNKQYLVNETLTVNPTLRSINVILKGVDVRKQGTYSNTENGSIWQGTNLHRLTPGTILSVNITDAENSPLEMYNNFGVENVGFCDVNESNSVIGVEMFRTRSIIKNVNSYGLKTLIYQPSVTRYCLETAATESNYCDLSTYEDIYLTKVMTTGLELIRSDRSYINRVHASITETTESIILLRDCRSTVIEGLLSANANNNLNYGGSISDSKSYIKLASCQDIKVKNLYLERPSLTNVLYGYGSEVLEVDGIRIKFRDNNIGSFNNCKNVKIKNISLLSDKVSGYTDIYTSSDCKYIEVENFTGTKYDGKTERILNRQGSANANFNTLNKQYRITYDTSSSSFKIFTLDGIQVTNIGAATFDTSKRMNFTGYLNEVAKLCVTPCYITASNMPYLPVLTNGGSIQFYDMQTGTRAESVSDKMSFILTV